MIKIKRLVAPEDAVIWRELSLEAMRVHPDNFVTAYAEEASIPLAQFEQALSEKCVFVTEDHAGLIVLKVQDDIGTINSVYVRAHARGKGYGDALLVQAKQAALALNLPAIQLYVFADNAPAVSLYQRQGFTLVKRADLDGREDWLMRCDLPISITEKQP